MEDEAEHILHNMRIPEYILQASVQQSSCSLLEKMPVHKYSKPPKYPTLVFVNSKSGGQQGRQFLSPCRVLLTPYQVVDLHEVQPEKLLQKILGELERLCKEGDHMATAVKENLRIIVAGGDGTAGWVLGIIAKMNLSHPLPLAPIPLGTGNNLHYSFGWGRKNIGTDLNSVKSLLIKVAKAKVMRVDSWHVIMRVPTPTINTLKSFTLPHSMHALDPPSSSDRKNQDNMLNYAGGFWNYFSLGMDAQVAYAFHHRRQKYPENFKSQLRNQDNMLNYAGGFWNYFSLGMDAQVAYAFHHRRQKYPENFKSQLRNQSTYGMLSCAQGWYCVNCFHPSSRNINHLGKIKYAKHDDEWHELHISPSIRSIVLLNLPSFSGGFDPWGNPSEKTSMKRNLTQPLADDGILEIVGFRDGWHGVSLLFPNGHGTRLAQAHKVRIEVSHVNHTYMRMDGEPWLQPLPEKDSPTIIEISHGPQALVLATEKCIAKNLEQMASAHD